MKRISVSLAILLALGCDGNGGTDSGNIELDGGGDGGGGETDAGMDAGGSAGDGNDSFATAETVEIDATEPASGVIATDGDLDYFRFEGEAGQWVQILTEANADDDPEMIDTVITLYDASMTRIAENDDALPRTSTDSELITRLPAAGTYYVLVQEFSSWADEELESDLTYTYELSVFAVADEVPAVNIDLEDGNTVADALPLTFTTGATGASFAFVLGRLDTATDIDVFSFTMPSGDPRNFSIELMPGTDVGYGSTAQPTRMWVTNEAGDVVIARVDPSDVSLEPSLGEGSYNLFVEHGGTAGANDFYVMKVFRLAENPVEADELANNLPATPEPLDMATSEIGRSGFLLARLGAADIDHFSFVPNAGEQVTIACGSRTSGSGVLDLELTLLEADGITEVASDTETETESPLIEDQALTVGETYLVRLTKSGQDATVTGDWVRCGVHLIVPEP